MPPRKTTTAVAARSRRPAVPDRGLGWENISKTLVVLALVITPLIISSRMSDSWEQPKTIVLAGLMSLAWLSFFISLFSRKTVSWGWHVLDWFAILLGGATVVSTLVSVRGPVSLWGLGGWSSSSLPAVVSFISLYFLTSQLFRSRHDQAIGWTALMTGTGAALLVMLFQLSSVSILPAELSSNPLLGTISSTPAHVAVMAALFGAVALLLWSRTTERWAKWGIVACVVISWLVLFFLRQPLGWAIFALGMMSVVVEQSIGGRTTNIRLLTAAVALAAAGMLLQLTGAANHANLPATNDISLDQRTSSSIAWSTFLDRPVLGSGPVTWYQDFVQHRPLSFNQSPYWSLRFVSAASELWQQLATGGLVTLGLWFGFLVMAGWWMWSHVRKQPRAALVATALIITTAIVVGFLSTWSWLLVLWLWASIGLSRAQLTTTSQPTRMGAAAPLWFSVLILALVGYWWTVARVTASDIAYQQGRQLYNQIAPIDHVIAQLNTSVKLNPKNTSALTLLGNAEVTKAQLAVQQSSTTDVTAMLQPAVGHLRQAIAADPRNPALYEEMNNLLNRLSGAISDVAVEANVNFHTLEKLEPTNPIHDVGDGQTLMVIRQGLTTTQNSAAIETQRKDLLDQAITAYRRALSKKPDYGQARFALAQSLAEGGQNDQALSELDQITSTFGHVSEFWVERAVVFSNLKENDQADQAFKQALQISPTDSSLYLSYANALVQAGQPDKAKEILQQGLKAFPSTTELQQRLDGLNKT